LVRVLVLAEVQHLDVRGPVDRVSQDESVLLEVGKQTLDVRVVVRQRLGLDLLRPVLQSTFSVGHRPQRDEEEPAERVDLGERVVREESRLDVASAGHRTLPS
jgi:hypothetical protein